MQNRVRYYANRPGRGRASYSILRDTVRPDGKRESVTVKDERLAALNAAYRSGAKGKAECDLEIQAIIESLYKAIPHAPLAFHEDNEKTFRQFWKKEYSRRKIVDLESARNYYQRALHAIGTVSLISGSEDAILKALRPLRGNRQRRIAAALNTLLEFVGREFRVQLDPKERRRIKHLSPGEFAKVLEHVEEPELLLLYATLFSTGARVGEAFAMQPEDFRGKDTVRIHSQLTRAEMLTATKNRRERTVVIHPEYIEQVRQWANLPNREEIRRMRFAELLAKACEKAFHRDDRKRITAHDLRHSYAIYLLGQGVSMGLVAQSLANSVQVCQEYYAGFELSPQGIAEIQHLLRPRL